MNFLLINRYLSLTHLLVFLFLLGNIGCQKESSTEIPGPNPGPGGGGGGGNAGGTAQFSLMPSGSNCSDAAVVGTFQEGTALGIDALLTVTVNVTKTGDWTYSTAIVNGFLFAGGGKFTAKGAQVIILQAAGKPRSAVNSVFKLDIGGATCTLNVAVSPSGGGGGGGGGTIDEFYYKATIDGISYTQSVTETNGYEPGSGMSGVDDVSFGGGITYGNPPLPAGKTEFGIDRGFMHQYTSATQAQFKAFFAPADYPYSALLNDMTDNGVKIYWTDPTGEVWNSKDKTDQTGSTFKIISAQELVDLAGTYYVIVKVQFTCKLYNAAGAMKTLTNGEAVVAFGML